MIVLACNSLSRMCVSTCACYTVLLHHAFFVRCGHVCYAVHMISAFYYCLVMCMLSLLQLMHDAHPVASHLHTGYT